jgi:hypothetical protein
MIPCRASLARVVTFVQVVSFVGVCCHGSAFADAPPFDRPGIAFSTGTLPAGAFMWEQSAPDVGTSARSDDAATTYGTESRVRAGLTDSVEGQLATSFFNATQSHVHGRTETADGHGDTALSVKAALPSSNERFAWATLATVTFANGANRFTNGSTAYDLGTTLGYQLSDATSAEFFVDVGHLDGATDVQISPNLNVGLTKTLGAFVEAGAVFADHGTSDVVAGGGVTWMATPAVQLDASADFGLTRQSPKVAAGFGVSVFFR